MRKAFVLLFLPFLLIAKEGDTFKIDKQLPKLEITNPNSYNYFRSCGYGLYKEDEMIMGTSLGLGSRYRDDLLGYGFSINITYLGICPYFSLRGEVLHYFEQTPNSYFVGFTADAGPFYDDLQEWIFLAKGEIMFGKEFTAKTGKKSFAYLGIDPFFRLIEDNITPLVSINYGWGF